MSLSLIKLNQVFNYIIKDLIQNCIFVRNFRGSQHLVLRILRILRNLRIRLGENTYALIHTVGRTYFFFSRQSQQSKVKTIVVSSQYASVLRKNVP